jgi:hypothetical protein
MDSPSVLGALLDFRRGGRFALAPKGGYEVERRYIPNTNVLQTTYHTPDGIVRVTDALTLPLAGLSPFRELVRRVEGLAGRVQLHWVLEPRFGWAGWPTRFEMRDGVPVAAVRSDAVAVCSWNAGEVCRDDSSFSGVFEISAGRRALFALAAAHQEPLVFPAREEVEARLDATTLYWARWSDQRAYNGPGGTQSFGVR